MLTPHKQARLDELDTLLRSDGVDVNEVAKRWQVQPDWVRHHLTLLRNVGAKIEKQYLGPGKRRYFYADSESA